MSKVTGLLNFLAQAPGQVFGGLLGPSPLSPGMSNQLPQGFDDQARKQAIQQMAIAAMSAPRGQQLAQATQTGQTGYRSSLVDMLRMQEMERMQGERKAEADRVARLRGEDPRFANLSPQSIEEVMVSGLTYRPDPVKPKWVAGDIRKYESGTDLIVEEFDGEKWNVKSRGPRFKEESGGSGSGGKPTELQRRTVSFLTRMENANSSIGKPEDEAKFGSSSYLKDIALNSQAEKGGVLGDVAQLMVSDDYRGYVNNAREWISGLLRFDSGAAVPEIEFQRYFRTYFALPGDSPAEVTEKSKKRRIAEQGMREGLNLGSMPDNGASAASGAWQIEVVE